MNKIEFVTLYNRELDKFQNEVDAYTTDDQMWTILPGTINSGGNLAQHLIGNLRTYIGLTLGEIPYLRNRDAEFKERLFTKGSLSAEIEILKQLIESSISGLSEEDLQSEYSKDVLPMFPEQTVNIILTHLLIHLGYHLGQLNYHRRTTEASQGRLEFFAKNA